MRRGRGSELEEEEGGEGEGLPDIRRGLGLVKDCQYPIVCP